MSTKQEIRAKLERVEKRQSERLRQRKRIERRLEVVKEALAEVVGEVVDLLDERAQIAAGETLADLPEEERQELLAQLGERVASLREEARKLRRRRRELRRRRRRAVAAVRKGARRIRNLTRKLRNLARPKVISAADQGIYPSAVFGPLGSIQYVTGHHTAGPTDDSREDAIRMNRSYHEQHARNGWGGIGYHYNLARTGEILCLRPIEQKGAHVGGYNTGNVGITCHGTVGDQPTRAQRRAFRWLLKNAHTSKMPAAHRSPVPLSDKPRRGHNDWPGHTSNACPGTHKQMYLSGGAR